MEQINRLELYKVKYHQIKMLHRRGYVSLKHGRIENELLNRSPLESIEIFDSTYYKPALLSKEVIESKLSDIYSKPTGTNGTDLINVIYVNIKEGDKILKGLTDEIIERITNQPILHIILISKGNFTSKNYGELLKLSAYRIEHFLYEELFYDPTAHERQPTFELLSETESEAELKRLKKDSDKLLHLCIDDPIVKYLGGIAGQLVKIKRLVETKALVDRALDVKIITNESIYHDQKKQ